MKYRLEVYNKVCVSLDYADQIKDLFLTGCDHSNEKGFEGFSLFDNKTGEKIFTLTTKSV